MPLIEHLRELRNRLVFALLVIVAGAIVATLFYDRILEFLLEPYCDLPPEKRFSPQNSDCGLAVLDPLSGFIIRIKVSIIAGATLTAPLWLYQIWAFVSPGLHAKERRYSTIFVVVSSLLFAAGALLAYYTLGKGLTLLVNYAGEGTFALFTVDKYIGFVSMMLLVFGASMEVPLLVVMLNMIGVLSYRRLRRFLRMAFFLIFVFAAVVTPSQDPFTMLALSVPMCVLFAAAVVLAFFHDRRKERREAEASFRDLGDDVASPLDTTPSSLDD